MTHHLFLGMFEAPSLFYQTFLSLARHFTLRWTQILFVNLFLLVACSPNVWTQQVHPTNCAWKVHTSVLDSVPKCIQLCLDATNCIQVHSTLPKYIVRVHDMPIVCLTIMQMCPNLTLLAINLLRFPSVVPKTI